VLVLEVPPSSPPPCLDLDLVLGMEMGVGMVLCLWIMPTQQWMSIQSFVS
jgi:hypothetical protein